MIEENFIKIYEKSFKENWDLPALTDYNTRETFIVRLGVGTRLLLSAVILPDGV